MLTKRTKYLIVDTTAFIRTVQLHEYGENIITVAEVIEEIRNKRQYRSLFSLAKEVEIKPVFSESINHVVEFAKKTGDYRSLSMTDIKVLALTYQMEIEQVGRDHLRKSPVMQNFKINTPICTTPLNKSEEKSTNNNEDYEETKELLINEKEENSGEEEVYVESEDQFNENQHKIEYDSEEEELTCTSTDEESDYEEEINDNRRSIFGSWITNKNLSSLTGNLTGSNLEDKEISVGCMTSDFAMQNVLMQMGLNVVSLEGKLITQLRAYILRCYACFNLTSNMKKVFCSKCGNKTLKRVSVYVDKDGNKHININFKKPISTRGKRFSLPFPKGGKHFTFPKLAEDAKRPQQKPSRLAKTKTNALMSDYICNTAPFAVRDVYSRSAHHGYNHGKVMYWMRKNPNEPRPHK